jgi:hypothetical protein
VDSKNIFLTATGSIFIAVGLLGLYFFVFKGIKPDWLQLNVFTVYSKYLETKTFTVIQNNQGDELAVTSYCTGWLLIILRHKPSFTSRQSLVILVFTAGYLLLHGLAVIYFMLSFLFILPLFFLISIKYESFFSKHKG